MIDVLALSVSSRENVEVIACMLTLEYQKGMKRPFSFTKPSGTAVTVAVCLCTNVGESIVCLVALFTQAGGSGDESLSEKAALVCEQVFFNGNGDVCKLAANN